MMLPFFLSSLSLGIVDVAWNGNFHLPPHLSADSTKPTTYQLSSMHASALLASSDPVPFTLLVAGDCFAFWVPSSK